MKKLLLAGFAWILCSSAVAQEKGIRFEKDLSWKQIVAKAKKEKKFIFVDCYATWCGPCKKMEQDVYPVQEVGTYFNGKFVSVKYQMDSTAKDDDAIRRRYADVRYIRDKYQVKAYPTYLFFTPEGELLNTKVGGSDAVAFVNSAAEVIDPSNNYKNFVRDYRKGKKELNKVPYMMPLALVMKDTALAEKMAEDYMTGLPKEQWFAKDNIQFFARNTKNTQGRGFELFRDYSEQVDSAMSSKDYAKQVAQVLIYREHVMEVLQKSFAAKTEPDWDAINAKLQRQYGEYYARRVIVSSRMAWARNRGQWSEYAKYLVEYVDKYKFPIAPLWRSAPGSMEDFVLNNYAWDVFKYSNNREELIKALSWSSRAVMMNPTANWMDTYANLLHKLGQTEYAVQWEEMASKLDPKDASIRKMLEKMKRGEPTWEKLQ